MLVNVRMTDKVVDEQVEQQRAQDATLGDSSHGLDGLPAAVLMGARLAAPLDAHVQIPYESHDDKQQPRRQADPGKLHHQQVVVHAVIGLAQVQEDDAQLEAGSLGGTASGPQHEVRLIAAAVLAKAMLSPVY